MSAGLPRCVRAPLRPVREQAMRLDSRQLDRYIACEWRPAGTHGDRRKLAPGAQVPSHGDVLTYRKRQFSRVCEKSGRVQMDAGERWSDRSFRHLPIRIVSWLFVVLVQSVCLGDRWSSCGGCAPCCVLSLLAWLDFGNRYLRLFVRRSGARHAQLTSTVLHVQQTQPLHLVSTAEPLLTPYAVTVGRPPSSATARPSTLTRTPMIPY